MADVLDSGQEGVGGLNNAAAEPNQVRYSSSKGSRSHPGNLIGYFK
jgi:hypothetical protein